MWPCCCLKSAAAKSSDEWNVQVACPTLSVHSRTNQQKVILMLLACDCSSSLLTYAWHLLQCALAWYSDYLCVCVCVCVCVQCRPTQHSRSWRGCRTWPRPGRSWDLSSGLSSKTVSRWTWSGYEKLHTHTHTHTQRERERDGERERVTPTHSLEHMLISNEFWWTGLPYND